MVVKQAVSYLVNDNLFVIEEMLYTQMFWGMHNQLSDHDCQMFHTMCWVRLCNG